MKNNNELQYFSIIKDKIVEMLELNNDESESITVDSYIDYNGVGLDSLQLLSLLVCLEDECNFELTDTDLSLTQFTQIKDLVDFLSNKISNEEN